MTTSSLHIVSNKMEACEDEALDLLAEVVWEMEMKRLQDQIDE